MINRECFFHREYVYIYLMLRCWHLTVLFPEGGNLSMHTNKMNGILPFTKATSRLGIEKCLQRLPGPPRFGHNLYSAWQGLSLQRGHNRLIGLLSHDECLLWHWCHFMIKECLVDSVKCRLDRLKNICYTQNTILSSGFFFHFRLSVCQ